MRCGTLRHSIMPEGAVKKIRAPPWRTWEIVGAVSFIANSCRSRQNAGFPLNSRKWNAIINR